MSLQIDLDRIEAIVNDEFRSNKFPGLAVALIQDKSIKWFGGFGHADINAGISITADTVFRLASISKTFTTIGLMQLHEKGMFELNEPVNNYLPRGKVIVRKGWDDVTFMHLLTHRSGIGELMKKIDAFKPGFGIIISGKDKTIPPLSSIHDKGIKTEVAPGSKYAYSNIGFSLLGYLIEQISGGVSFRDYIKKNIFDPLGMENSDFIRSERIKSLEAEGYERFFGKFKRAPYPNNIIMPAGNLYSSINDMTKYANCLLDFGLHDGGRLLKEKTFKLMWTPQYWSHDAIKDEISIGLCFFLHDVNGFKVVEHTGATNGFTSAFTLIPEEKIAILVFSNVGEIFSTRRTLIIKNKILQLILGSYDETGDNSGYFVDDNVIKQIKGYYGPDPGILTNTRIWMAAGDYKITGKNNRVYLSSFWGSKRKGILLRPGDESLVFNYGVKRGYYVHRTVNIAFSKDMDGNIIEMCIGLHRFRKNHFLNTLRFKFYFLIIMIIVCLVFLAMALLLFK
ncbi:MAG: serine hydrolase domain-containing protein [Promethearchaeota archaeon]